MKYLNTRKLFLFDTIGEYVKLLDDIEDNLDYSSVIKKMNIFLLDMSKGFVEFIFKVVYQHVKDLELSLNNELKVIAIEHIRNIYRGIVSNVEVEKILKKINEIVIEINNISEFDIKKYRQVIDLVEELDFICMFEMYSYLLREDSEDVFSFIVTSITKDFVSSSSRNSKFINEKVLAQIEKKIDLFKKFYSDYDDISLIEKNEDRIIYKVNDILKVVKYSK